MAIDPETAPSFVLDCRGRGIDASPGRPVVMGILNVTPDSFSDGGRFLDPDGAAARAFEMLDQGAQIVDVGGASSRPRGRAYGDGAAALRPEVEIARVRPVIESILAGRPDAVVSIDTVHSEVARAALEAGASIVNDVTALRTDPRLAEVAADAGAALFLMHSVGSWGDLVHEAAYSDVVEEVVAHLARAVGEAEAAGVRSIAVDAGFGFGKTTRDNLRLLGASERLLRLGRPVVVGISRKSAVGRSLGSEDDPWPVDRRLFGTLGATAWAFANGASIVRTHDVTETVQMLRVLSAAMRER